MKRPRVVTNPGELPKDAELRRAILTRGAEPAGATPRDHRGVGSHGKGVGEPGSLESCRDSHGKRAAAGHPQGVLDSAEFQRPLDHHIHAERRVSVGSQPRDDEREAVMLIDDRRLERIGHRFRFHDRLHLREPLWQGGHRLRPHLRPRQLLRAQRRAWLKPKRCSLN